MSFGTRSAEQVEADRLGDGLLDRRTTELPPPRSQIGVNRACGQVQRSGDLARRLTVHQLLQALLFAT